MLLSEFCRVTLATLLALYRALGLTATTKAAKKPCNIVECAQKMCMKSKYFSECKEPYERGRSGSGLSVEGEGVRQEGAVA